MKRWAVCFTSTDGMVNWVSQGAGSSNNVQMAYLYSKKGLAENKAKYFRERPEWFSNVSIIQFDVALDFEEAK